MNENIGCAICPPEVRERCDAACPCICNMHLVWLRDNGISGLVAEEWLGNYVPSGGEARD